MPAQSSSGASPAAHVQMVPVCTDGIVPAPVFAREAAARSAQVELGATVTTPRPIVLVRRSGGASRYAVRLGSIGVGLLLWQLLTAHAVHFVLDFRNVPTPQQVWSAFLDVVRTREFFIDIAVSLERIAIAFVLAGCAGIGIGVLIGRFRLAQDLLTPHVEIFRPIPAVAWVPLAIIMLPTQESSIVFITALGAFFPVVINTVMGVSQTPKVLVQAARSLGAGDSAILRHVVLPSALPAISAGLIVGMGVAWFSLLAGEMISGQYGIGYYTWNAYSLVQYPQIVIGMICIGILGTVSTHLVRLLTRPWLRWQVGRVGVSG